MDDAAFNVLNRLAPMSPMSAEEKAFFKSLGTRIAAFRKDHAMTQQQLADLVGVAQQVIGSWEPQLARALAVSVEDLIGEEPQPGKRGPAPKHLQQIERIQRLPKAQQRFVMQMIDTVLQQAAR